MPRLFAFLRAINVGGRTVRMQQLRGLFGELGFVNVETFIASGNVAFEGSAPSTAALEQKIERHLRASLGYDVHTFLRTVDEFAETVRREVFPPPAVAAAHGVYVAFLQRPPSRAGREALLDARSAVDDFRVHGREVYWLCRARFSESAFSGPLLERTLGVPVTVRNMTTLCKLAARHGLA